MPETYNNKRDPIHVVCAADANYGSYAGIMLASVLGSNEEGGVYIHLFSDGMRGRDIERTAQMAHRLDAEISIYDIKQKFEEISNIPQKIHHYTRTSYCRLFLPEFLPVHIGRVIYLDCDVICVASLRDLWRAGEDLELLGAVRDRWVDEDRRHKASLGMPADAAYYNAGVLLINVESWRRRKVGDRLVHFLAQTGKTQHADQDAINYVLWQEIRELPRRWNVLITSPIPGEVGVQLKSAANIHFCGGLKPWHFGYRALGGSGAEAFRRAKAASPWRWMLPDFHFARLRRKAKQWVSPG